MPTIKMYFQELLLNYMHLKFFKLGLQKCLSDFLFLQTYKLIIQNMVVKIIISLCVFVSIERENSKNIVEFLY